MYFSGDDGYQDFLVFALMLSSLTVDSNKKVTNWISTKASLGKFVPIYTNLELTTNNFAYSYQQFSIETVILVGNAIESKSTYNGQEIAFHGKVLQNFGDSFARNIVIFVVNNSSSSHADNSKNNFLVLGEGPTDSISGRIFAAGKKYY